MHLGRVISRKAEVKGGHTGRGAAAANNKKRLFFVKQPMITVRCHLGRRSERFSLTVNITDQRRRVYRWQSG